jgi:hypothetical protein
MSFLSAASTLAFKSRITSSGKWSAFAIPSANFEACCLSHCSSLCFMASINCFDHLSKSQIQNHFSHDFKKPCFIGGSVFTSSGSTGPPSISGWH